ncbi:AmmeMemoRadiSam system protein A [Marinobacterium weihaiense]|uniref:AmmeMemoRadiSam system protein A n=1 Tax=Marinobacterium weihaiense TaxID=2851016 RepID=A0ABS6M7Z4_9GAMM|nr:AmmeMemoRadiSam system protein A [Marinobacterium weihaiense]MBV0931907.1 AmmeMemoRadiSam system protein A [Marinobacterium weihaiense]
MSVIEYSTDQQQYLLALARRGVCQSVLVGSVDMPDITSLPAFLRHWGACFVSLTEQGRLRGCIGSLEASRPLAHDVLHNACGAALHDYRFAPLNTPEPILITLSVLSPLEVFTFSDEADLLRQLVPGRDGLLLQAGQHRATFLPQVWESFSQPDEFVQALKRKAGLADDFWSDQVRVWRYSSVSFAETEERPACE